MWRKSTTADSSFGEFATCALRDATLKVAPHFKMILPIFQYGDSILRAKGERIEKIDERIRELVGEHD